MAHNYTGRSILTYRRDQVTFKPDMLCGDQLIGGIIFCGSAQGRDNWIRYLNKKHPTHFNHFVCFMDVQSPFALQFGFADWTTIDRPYILR